jgi:hypothetical protein
MPQKELKNAVRFIHKVNIASFYKKVSVKTENFFELFGGV